MIITSLEKQYTNSGSRHEKTNQDCHVTALEVNQIMSITGIPWYRQRFFP